MPQGSIRLPPGVWYVPETYFDYFDALHYFTAGITKAEFMACKVYQDYVLSLNIERVIKGWGFVARVEHLDGKMSLIYEGLVITSKYKARLVKAGELSLAREKILAEKKVEVEVVVQASEVCGVVFEEKKVPDGDVLVVSGVGDVVSSDEKVEVLNEEVVAFSESGAVDGCVKGVYGEKDEVPVDVDVDNLVCLDGKDVTSEYIGDLPIPDEKKGFIINEEVLVVSESSAADGNVEGFLDGKDGVRVGAESVVCFVGKDGFFFNDGRDKNLSDYKGFLSEEQMDESFEKKLDSIWDEVDAMARDDKPMIVWNVVNLMKRSLKVLDVVDNYGKVYGVFEPQVIYGGGMNNYYFEDDYEGYGFDSYDGKEV